MRKRTHVARALDIVLPAQRIHADARPPDVAGCHREIRDTQHHRTALAVLGDAESVVDRAVGSAGIQARRRTNLVRWYASNFLHRLRRIARLRDKLLPRFELMRVTSCGCELFVGQTFRHHDMRNRVDQRDVGAGANLQMIRRLHVWQPHDFGDARIDDDQLRALADSTLHLRGENRMPFRDVRADHHDHVGLHHRIEILGRRRGAERGLESVAGRRMTNARAGIDVVVAEPGAHQFLHEKSFLVGASRGRDRADRAAPVFFLEAPELRRRVFDRVGPRDLAPRRVD